MVEGKFEERLYKYFSRTTQKYLNRAAPERYDWVSDHPHVVNDPITNETIIIRDENKDKKRVGKILLQMSIQEIHNYLLSAGPLESM